MTENTVTLSAKQNRDMRVAAVKDAEVSLKEATTTTEKHFARLQLARAQRALEALE